MKKAIVFLLLVFVSANSFSQNFKQKFHKISKDKKVTAQKEKVVYEATKYIFSNAPSRASEEFIYATKIAGFWMNLDTGYGMPIYGGFYNSLTLKGQKFLYTTAMMYYLIQQKLDHDRLIIFVKKEGVKFSELETVKETQCKGAEVLLKYFQDYKVKVSRKTEKFMKKLGEDNFEAYFIKKNRL